MIRSSASHSWPKGLLIRVSREEDLVFGVSANNRVEIGCVYHLSRVSEEVEALRDDIAVKGQISSLAPHRRKPRLEYKYRVEN